MTHVAPNRDRKAFTLVELLVVIGIIALLISILLPSLNRARQAANAVACLSNLRQVGIALTMYTQQNQGLFPTAEGGGNEPWEQLLARATGTRALSGTPSMFHCADAADRRGRRHFGVHPRLIVNPGWGDGAFPDPKPPMRVYKLPRLRRITEIAVVFDASQQIFAEGWNVPGNTDDVLYNLHSSRMFWQGYVYNANDSSNGSPVRTYGTNRDATNGGDSARGHIRWRHLRNSAGNFLFADGHAATLKHRGRASVVHAGDLSDGGDLKQSMVMVNR